MRFKKLSNRFLLFLGTSSTVDEFLHPPPGVAMAAICHFIFGWLAVCPARRERVACAACVAKGQGGYLLRIGWQSGVPDTLVLTVIFIQIQHLTTAYGRDPYVYSGLLQCDKDMKCTPK